MIDGADPMRKAMMTLGWASGTASWWEGAYGGLGAILMLHRLGGGEASPLGVNRHLSMEPDFLDRMIGDLKEAGYEFISMDGVLDRLNTPRPGHRRFVCLTLDDGYRDNLEAGLPLFRKHQVPFAVYVAPGLVDGSAVLWWEVVERLVSSCSRITLPGRNGNHPIPCHSVALKRKAYFALLRHFTEEIGEEEQMGVLQELCATHGMEWSTAAAHDIMGWDEIRRIAADPLCTIGAHSVNHYHLRRLAPDVAFDEMVRSAEILQEKLGKRPEHLAYRYGYADAAGLREAGMAEKIGFASAVTSRHGTIHPDHAQHRHALPRISLNGRYQRPRYVRAMISGFTTPLANGGQRVVTV